MLKAFCPPISLTSVSGKRVRLTRIEPGSALCAVAGQVVAAPQPIVGYWYRSGHLTVYVNGPMPAGFRTALEDARTEEEVLLQPLPAGIQEIDLTDCRRAFRVLPAQPQAA